VDGPDVVALAAQLGELIDLVDALEPDDFARPTRCPGWSVAELVAHCEGILDRLVGENARPVDGKAVSDRVGYYRFDPDGPREGEDPNLTFSEVIRDRVVKEVGGRTGAELRDALERAIEHALAEIIEIPNDRVIWRSGHPLLTYGEFVASRNVEFGVHTMDIAHAVGRPERVARDAEPIITGILDGLLGTSLPDTLGWDATTYILTGTGRRELTPGERAVLGDLADRFPLLR
jgi:uncharacterized protein (TIGR03083 family)